MSRTLLIPALLDDWFPLLQYAFASREWTPVLLKEDRGLADRGLGYFHNELCYPVFLVAGQVLAALESGEYDPARCGVLMGQAGDACRGSCGIRLMRKALDRAGTAGVPECPRHRPGRGPSHHPGDGAPGTGRGGVGGRAGDPAKSGPALRGP